MNCLVCENGICEPFIVVKGHQILRCIRCSSTRRKHIPESFDLSEFYDRYLSYKKQFGDEYLVSANFKGEVSKEMSLNDLGMAGEIFTDKHVLDVGCGSGQLMEWVTQFHPSTLYGIDISAENVSLGLEKGLNISTANFLETNRVCDVIIMSHLIEHLPEPLLFVEHAFKLLDKGGILIVETPCVGPVQEEFGEDWRYWLPEEHLVIFSESGLIEAFKKVGFSSILKTRFGSGVDDGDVTSAAVKKCIDRLVKHIGVGDTIFVMGRKS